MGLETANNIGELVETNPVSGDGVNQGDDHIRLIKTLLKQELPVPTKGVVGGASGQLLMSNGSNGMGLSTYNQSNIADHASRITALEGAPTPSGTSVVTAYAPFTLTGVTDTFQNMVQGGTPADYDPDSIIQSSRIVMPTGYRICRITFLTFYGDTLGNNHDAFEFQYQLSVAPNSFTTIPDFAVPALSPRGDLDVEVSRVYYFATAGQAFYLQVRHDQSGSIPNATGDATAGVDIIVEMLR